MASSQPLRRCQVPEGYKGRDQAPAMLELLLALMRFLSWRLKPKAAARPRAGRGPNTGADGTSVAWAHVYDSRILVSIVTLGALLRRRSRHLGGY